MDAIGKPTMVTEGSGRARFGLRLGCWLLLYAALVLPWGIYNGWPGSLLVSVVYLPFCLLIAVGLGRRHGFGIETPEPPSHWELLISFLLLAVGIATGYMLLISVAWICVGVAWLRPGKPGLAWSEWYKLPVLFLFAMPILSDVAGSRHGWLFAFRGAGGDGPVAAGWMEALRGPSVFRLGLLALAWMAPGTIFWALLGFLPLVFLAAHGVEHFVPEGLKGPSRWLLPMAGLAMIVALARRPAFSPLVRGPLLDAAVNEFKHRTHALWLAALVTLMQQQSLVEVWLAGGRSKMDLTGATLLLMVLGITRLATPPTLVDFRSRVVLVASQLILFAAEFTDLNPLRHAAMGVFLVAATSWGRTWNWVLLASSSACWMASIPAAETVLVMAGVGEGSAGLMRLGAFMGTIMAAVGAAGHAVNHPSRPSAAQHDWQPEQRYVLTLLSLLLLFQTISAFRTEPATIGHLNPTPSPVGGQMPSIRRLEAGVPPAAVERYEIVWAGKRAELRIIHAGPAPVDVVSTEMMLRREHWRPEGRALISHDRGQAATLDLQQAGRTAHAVYWFQHGARSFVNHLRARRILWSTWNLSHRDLHFYLLIADTPVRNEDLVALAQAHGWFLPSR